MPLINEPDYSKYTLDELRVLARRVRNAGDADLRWRLKVEMARREKEEDSQRRNGLRFFSFQRDEPRHFQRWLFDNESEPRDYRWLFEHDETPRTTDEIFLWWADRRQFWSRSLLLVSGCGIVSYFSILLASSVLRDGFNLNAVSNSLLRVAAISVWACIVVLIIFLVVSNVVY